MPHQPFFCWATTAPAQSQKTSGGPPLCGKKRPFLSVSHHSALRHVHTPPCPGDREGRVAFHFHNCKESLNGVWEHVHTWKPSGFGQVRWRGRREWVMLGLIPQVVAGFLFGTQILVNHAPSPSTSLQLSCCSAASSLLDISRAFLQLGLRGGCMIVFLDQPKNKVYQFHKQAEHHFCSLTSDEQKYPLNMEVPVVIKASMRLSSMCLFNLL